MTITASTERRKQDVEAIAALTALQQGILVHSLESGEHDPYFHQWAFELEGEVNITALEDSWRWVASRHQALRADYRWEESSTPIQVVYKSRPVRLESVDWRGRAPAEQRAALLGLLREERGRGFDFRQAADLRLRLIRVQDARHWFVWSLHHVALDGWSVALVLRDLLGAYRKLESGGALEPGASVPYVAYADWLAKRDKLEGSAYFEQLLAGLELATPLPRARPLPAELRCAELTVTLGRAETARITQAARGMGVTLNTLLQGAWALLLGRHAGVSDVVFGVTVSGRSQSFAGAEGIAGLLINTLPLRVRLTSDASIQSWLRALQGQNVDSRRYEHIPLAEIEGPADGELLSSVLVFENYPLEEVLGAVSERLGIRRLPRERLSEDGHHTTGRNNYPLTLNIVPGQQLTLTLAYQCKWFERGAIEQLMVQLEHLVSSLCEQRDRSLGTLGLFVPEATSSERQPVPPREPHLVLEMFERYVREAPRAACLQEESRQLSYEQVGRASDRLAAALRARGVLPEDRVALCVERSIGFVIALLGVMKAGGAYVPLEPGLPTARARQLVQDSSARLVVCAPETRSSAEAIGAPLLEIEAEHDVPTAAPREPALHPERAAYVIYTSGSTGQPKGVVVSHGALGRYVTSALERLALAPRVSMAMVSTPAADLGHTTLFGALCSGRCLHLISPERAFDPHGFARYMHEHQVGALKIVPSHLEGLFDAGPDVLPSHALILGGEATSGALLERIRHAAPACRIINHYGPTETTVGVATHELPPGALEQWVLPIGRGLPHARLHVLDTDLHPLPSGVAGELYVAGDGLARGYLGAPRATAERFVPNPHASRPGERLYRTGDRVVAREDGALTFLGRLDAQVKIRGFRIELGEVEAALSKHPSVRQVVVVVRQSESTARLVAYAVVEGRSPRLADELVAHSRSLLPEQMVPTQIVFLDQLPLNKNGKLDRKRLPDPERPEARAPVAPTTAIEQQLVEIWREVLRLESVGVRDNFFALGGDSILSLQIIARARKRGLKVTPKQIFEKQTISELALVAEELSPARSAARPAPALAEGHVPLTPIQARFFEARMSEPALFTQSILLAAKKYLDAERLSAALECLVMHHAALRLRFHEREGAWQQRHEPAEQAQNAWREDPLLWRRPLGERSQMLAIEREARHSLNLERGPLLRVVLTQNSAGEQSLLLVIHHLVVDAVSFRVLGEDLEGAYEALLAGRKPELPEPASTFKAWATRWVDAAGSDIQRRALEYWVGALGAADVSRAPLLPEQPGSGEWAPGGSEPVRVKLSRARTAELLTQAHAAYRTQINDLLLTALARAACALSGEGSLLVELEGHGREDCFKGLDVSRTVGWFSTLFPVVLRPVQHDLSASIKAVKEALRQVPQRGLPYGVLRYLGDAQTRARLEALPRPQLTFNYLGQVTEAGSRLFELSNEQLSSGEDEAQRFRNGLSLLGQVRSGELLLTCRFDGAVHRREAVERLMSTFERELDVLIEHCLDSGSGGLTPSDVPLAGLSQAELDGLGLPAREVEDLYPLSPLQQGLLFHSAHSPGAGMYVSQLGLSLRGLESARFRAAWQVVISRHTALRTAISWPSGRELPLQVVYRSAELPVLELDLSTHASPQAALDELAAAERLRELELERAPLQRLLLVKLAQGSHRVIWTRHHILMDGWSTARLLGELLESYGGAAASAGMTRYRDYIEWLGSVDVEASRSFWSTRLSRLDGPSLLAKSLGARAVEPGYGSLRSRLEARETTVLKRFAEERRITLNTLIQGAWILLLQRYTGQRCVVFGATVAGRSPNLPGIESMIGLFINTLPILAEPRSEQSVGEWLDELQAEQLELGAHEHTPLVEIQRWAGRAGQALFDTLLVFENYPVDAALRERGSSGLEVLDAESLDTTSYPLTLTIQPGERLEIEYSYKREDFTAPEVEGLERQLRQMLAELAHGPDQVLGRLELLTSPEREQLAAFSQAPAVAAARADEGAAPALPLLGARWDTLEASVLARGYIGLFEAYARQNPERVAASCAGGSITYRALDAWAARIGRDLAARGVCAEEPVLVLATRGLPWLASVLGVFKAGGAYLPLDPRQPPARLAQLLALSRPRAALVEPQLVPLLDEALPQLPGVELARLSPEQPPHAERSADLPLRITGSSLAYVLFTSGSTGLPKGALVEQRGMLNNQLSKIPWLGLTERDVIAQTAPAAFDISVWQLLLGLVCGARIEIVPDEIATDARALLAHIERTGITVLESVPSLIAALLDARDVPAPSLRLLLTTGEAMPVELARRFLQVHPQVGLVNAYGPAECSDDVALHRIESPLPPSLAHLPIGRPAPGLSLWLLDGELRPVPVGVLGEIHVAGIGVGRGYLHDSRRTASSFIPHPRSSVPGERLYRTGDLARYRPDGIIEYVGRRDFQVKIRGQRLELGEIEARLEEHASVRQAVVLARATQGGEGGQRLVAYVVPEPRSAELGSSVPSSEELLSYLRRLLPDYMVPAQVIALSELPLTANGKVDRAALPEPSWAGKRYVAPRSEMERVLVEIWQQALGRSEVGVLDDFFELGGDSIVALRLVHLARQRGIELSPRQVFERSVLGALAGVARERSVDVIDVRPVVGVVPLTPIQRWFFARRSLHPEHYNQSLVLGCDEELRPAELEQALGALVAHHDALRSRYDVQAGEWRQRCVDVAVEAASAIADPRLWVREAIDEAELERIGTEAQKSLSLERGPLLRGVLVRLPERAQRLIIAIHHLVVDGVSWRILLDDLQAAYRQRITGEPARLPAKTHSFQLWSERLGAYAESQPLKDQLACWATRLGAAGELELPRDFREGRPLLEHAACESVRLSRSHTEALQRSLPSLRLQINDVLLTALARALCRSARQPAVLVELEGHGREDLFPGVDFSRSVGWFTSLFPVLLAPELGAGDAALSASLRVVKEELRSLPARGVGYGVLRYLAAPEVRSVLERLPQARVTFNYMGQLDLSTSTSTSTGRGAFWRSKESCGAAQSADGPLDNWLTIHGAIEGGELHLSCTYSDQMYRRATIIGLMEDYLRELSALLAHMSSGLARALTPSDFPLAALSQLELERLPLEPSQIEDIYPLSPMQQGMLFHSLYSADGEMYVNQLTTTVKGLDVERFSAAWQSLSERHEILRTAFVWDGAVQRPIQIVFRQPPKAVEELDARALGLGAARLAELLAGERARVSRLDRPPLNRALLIRVADDQHLLAWTHHHMLLDGWSAARLISELMQQYAGTPSLPSPGRYADYIRWIGSKNAEESQRFWQTVVGRLSTPTLLGQALERTPGGAGRGLCRIQVDGDALGHLEGFARQERVTLNTLAQAAWALLLMRYTGQRHVAFGVTVAGRPAELTGSEQLLGLFINTLPVVTGPAEQQAVGAWLRELLEYNLTLREHEHTPLYDVQRWGPEPGQALFDSIVVFDNYPVERAFQGGKALGLEFAAPETLDATHYPMTVSVRSEAQLDVSFAFDAALFDEPAVRAIAEHFRQLLLELPRSSSRALGTVQMSNAAELLWLLRAGQPGAPTAAAGARAGRTERCLHQRIEAWAAERPAAVAVVCGDDVLTYRELNERANRLARRLRAAGVGPDVLVGLCLERGVELAVGVLAILKAGGAYVPIDPQYPRERVAYVIADSGVRLLLTEASLLGGLPALEVPAWCLDANDASQARLPAENLPSLNHPEHLAYCIYTSGSTGQPKGALVTHRNVLRLFEVTEPQFTFDERDVWTLFHSAAFDFSVWELFGALLYGGKLVVVPYYISRSPSELLALLVRERVTVLNQTPSAFKQILGLPELYVSSPALALRYVVFGGEALDARSLEPWFQHFGDREPTLVNMYGITETTVHVTYRALCSEDARRARGAIGPPIADLQTHVLDRGKRLAPLGVLGEIHVGGAGLCRGYHGRPGLTAERFIPHPFSRAPGERLYRSGDLARLGADGELSYAGRSDHQVKIRGFRIELGEIEAQLREHGAVGDVLVIARATAQGQQLVAYVVARRESDGLPDVLRSHLGQRLPEYMVPSHVVILDALPLTPNGKVDRRALPEPGQPLAAGGFVGPRTELEARIARIWEQVLGIQAVGVTHDFFDVGGHSLLATQVIGRIRGELLVNVPLADLFEARTLGQFAERVEKRRSSGAAAPELEQLEALLAEVEAP